LFRNSDFGANFCFNSKPSFSFDSRCQRIKFPVASNYSCNHRRIGLESKLRSRSLITGLKPVVNMCRSYGTFLIREKDFVQYYLITGLKPVVIMCRSYGTFHVMKKGFVRYYLITGLKHFLPSLIFYAALTLL